MLRTFTTARAPWLMRSAFYTPAPTTATTLLGLRTQTARRAITTFPRARPTAAQWTLQGARSTRRAQQTQRTFRFSARRQAEEAPLSMGARLKKLSKEYGWTAVGVYLGLSVLDFPFCFLLVKVVGTEKIAHVEHVVASFIPEPVKNVWASGMEMLRGKEEKHTGDHELTDKVEMAGWGVKEAEEANQAHASLATQLALAYAVHKSFIFVRVPLTAAVLPKVVKVLRGWGWNIGKKTPR